MQKHKFNKYPEMQEGFFNNLKNDIEVNGYDNSFPIYLYEDKIIDGWNRYRACKELNIEPIYKEFIGNDMEVISFILRTNNRRDLTPYQRSNIALEYEDYFMEKAKESKSEKVSHFRNTGVVLQKSAKPDTRKELAKIAKVSHDTIFKVKKINEKAPEETKEKLRTGEVSINAAYNEIKKEEKKEILNNKIQEIENKINKQNLVITDKKYHVIAIDPPWSYKERGGFSSDNYDSITNRGSVDYPIMTIEEIKKIKLPYDDDCVLFLWTTHAFLKDAFDVLEDWGFKYKATIVWDKVKMGIGRNIRMQVEFCLLGTKGSPILQGNSERDIITEARREHSRKPEAFYSMVDRLCIGNKLDYFSRQKRNNWDHYGAEKNKF
jgi:N6-adenosine-specific RNA methylase IME4